MKTLEPIYLSQLQHYIFCPRQFGLIELEDVWIENQWTAEGRVLHEKVDKPDHEKRGDTRIAWSLRLANEQLGISNSHYDPNQHQIYSGIGISSPLSINSSICCQLSKQI